MNNPKASKRSKIDDEAQTTDRISQLPEPILHHILAYLPTEDATRTCCLSKRWNYVWNSSPGLDFDQIAFEGDRTFKNNKARFTEFCNYIDECIKRRRQSEISIQEFKLTTYIEGPRKRVSLREHKWLDYAVNNNKLDRLFVHCYGLGTYYWSKRRILPYLLPEYVFSAKSLKELNLCGCKIPNMNINLSSLRKLFICHTHADQKTLEGMLSSCSLLEVVYVRDCTGFDTVKLAGLKLDKVYLEYSMFNEVQTIGIEAPNLRVLGINSANDGINSSIAGVNCKNLKKLTLSMATLTFDLRRDILSKLPALEKMKLRTCMWQKLENSSDAYNIPNQSVKGYAQIKSFLSS